MYEIAYDTVKYSDQYKVLPQNRYRVPNTCEDITIPGVSLDQSAVDYKKEAIYGMPLRDSISQLTGSTSGGAGGGMTYSSMVEKYKSSLNVLYENVEQMKKEAKKSRVKRKIDINKIVVNKMRFKHTSYSNRLMDQTKQMAFEYKISM